MSSRENSLKKYLKEHAEIIFDAMPEDEMIQDHIEDEICYKEILKDYESGNPAAWFCAKVVASWEGIESDPEYLGCCSYSSLEEFKQDSYYANMVEDTLNNLVEKLIGIHSALSRIL